MMGLYDKIFGKTAKSNNSVKKLNNYVKFNGNPRNFTPIMCSHIGEKFNIEPCFYDESSNTFDFDALLDYLFYIDKYLNISLIMDSHDIDYGFKDSLNWFEKFCREQKHSNELFMENIELMEENRELSRKLSENDYLGEIWDYIEQRTEHLEESDIIQNMQDEDNLLGLISELEKENEKLKQELNKLYCSEKYGVKRKNIPQNTRLEIFYRDKGVCSHCGEKLDVDGKWHIDHIFPVSKGGDNRKNNLQLLCPHCNMSKNNRTDILKDKQRLEELSDEYFEYSVNIRDIMEDSDEL